MGVWHLTGEIYVESAGRAVEYDIEVEQEWDEDDEPDAQTIFDYLVNTGDIQIIPGEAEYIPNEDDEDY